MEKDSFSMVQECTNTYLVEDLEENEVKIHILVPKRFRSLWLAKLSDLKTTKKEIAEYEEL